MFDTYKRNNENSETIPYQCVYIYIHIINITNITNHIKQLLIPTLSHRTESYLTFCFMLATWFGHGYRQVVGSDSIACVFGFWVPNSHENFMSNTGITGLSYILFHRFISYLGVRRLQIDVDRKMIQKRWLCQVTGPLGRW